MLRLKNLRKSYNVAGQDIEVLKGLDISFRKNEFVSILGPSGCGKTTTLNIIGGLDKYSSGDLFVGGISTKEFKDSDWDTYRNDRIGFVFQAYNLIPHQTVLGNVELALAIAGLSKDERIKKAKTALDEVGLTEHYYKKPNQLSGGQCQRVAIARALVNEPDILLADEPTGALDATTSVQIMELIKKISKDRLVIMVTHNPELALEYSTRIIKLLDGEVVDDSLNFSEEDEIKEVELEKKNNVKHVTKKTKMSWTTSFKLSVRNLLSKRKRTILTSIAGSIGIIGISLVLALSAGVKNYIASMQNDMLSGNPIEISEIAYDMSVMMNQMPQDEKEEFLKEHGYVNVDEMINDLANRFEGMENFQINNNITKTYIDFLKEMPQEYSAAMSYDYGINLKNNLYTDFVGYDETNNISLSLITNIYTEILKTTNLEKYADLIVTIDDVLSQLPNSNEYILSQYNLTTGKLPENKNEVILVLDKDARLSDLTLAQLGYFTQKEFVNSIYKAIDENKFDNEHYKSKFSNEELLNKKFTIYNNDDIFTNTLNPANPYTSFTPFTYDGYANKNKDGLELSVVGILEPKEDMSYGSLSSGMYYTQELTEYFINQNKDSEITTFLNDQNQDTFPYSVKVGEMSFFAQVLIKEYSYTFEDVKVTVDNSFLGTNSNFSSMMPGMGSIPSLDVYSLSLRELGGKDIPNMIKVYPNNFDDKDLVTTYLDTWNSKDDITINGEVITSSQREEIQYTDNLEMIIFMMNSFVNIVTVALIGFTSLALVVSCVMIAIITYVSILERVKEIGVIRSLGGRKKDVTRLFNVENLLIGLCSGTFGVLFTYLISMVINAVVYSTAGIKSIASLPINQAVIMIVLSTLLTIFSGLLPSFNAAKQDPVKALRTE